MEKLRAVKGMNDVFGSEVLRFQALETAFREWTARYGYREIRTPILEPTALFLRSIGDATDIVQKEMYAFVDKGNDAVALRPEGTASSVRAYIEHSVYAQDPITKWTYIGPMFRRERPARGRLRQFHQLGAEVYGDSGPYVDAEIIEMLVGYLTHVGITDIEVLINSLGSGDTRERYVDALRAHFTPLKETLSVESQERLERNPLRILDSKSEQDQAAGVSAPTILDFLSDEDRSAFDAVQSALKDAGINFRVEPRLVRGLDYYTRTLFEIRGRGGNLGAQDALCGGGRYDRLVEQLGGPKTPAIGFGIGIERLLLVLEDPGATPLADAFVVATSPALRGPATALLREIRANGIRADGDMRVPSVKSQFKRADRCGAKIVAVVGDEEHAQGLVTLKDMRTGEQRSVSRDGIGGVILSALRT